MLLELKIENFALAKDLEILFHPGLNVITGESGAGKSLMVEALSFVTGGKIRQARFAGEEIIRVQAVFDSPPADPAVTDPLKDAGVIEDGRDQVVLARKHYPSGRNLYQVNGQIVPLPVFRSAGAALVDIHGQKDSQYLLSTAHQREVLDMACGGDASSLVAGLARLHGDYRDVSCRLEKLQEEERDRNRQVDWLRFEIREIEEISPRPGEEEELERTRSILANGEKIAEYSASVHEALAGEGGAADRIGRAMADISRWARFDPGVKAQGEELSSALDAVRQAAESCREMGEAAEFDQERLDGVIERIHRLDSLKRKYGESAGEILAYLEKAREKLDELATSTQRMEELALEREGIYRQWTVAARQLSALRKEGASRLVGEILKELSSLGMEGADFGVEVSGPEGNAGGMPEMETHEVTAHGLDRVEFTISANPGEKLKPLSLIASGGELSRVMLALKSVFARFRNYSTLVMDEIDVGIGGVTSQCVGGKLREISRHRQVICVTHLPVIASMADVHFQIEKSSTHGGTRAVISPVEGKDRVVEVARMIAGERAPGETRKVAEKLLKGKI
jgi:DNA repair protein RecN (Recombination protein N)